MGHIQERTIRERTLRTITLEQPQCTLSLLIFGLGGQDLGVSIKNQFSNATPYHLKILGERKLIPLFERAKSQPL